MAKTSNFDISIHSSSHLFNTTYFTAPEKFNSFLGRGWFFKASRQLLLSIVILIIQRPKNNVIADISRYSNQFSSEISSFTSSIMVIIDCGICRSVCELDFFGFCTSNRYFLNGSKCQMCHCFYFVHVETQFSKSFGLNTSNEVSIDTFLFCNSLVKKNCIVDQSFLHRFDGKYHTGLVPLVSSGIDFNYYDLCLLKWRNSENCLLPTLRLLENNEIIGSRF